MGNLTDEQINNLIKVAGLSIADLPKTHKELHRMIWDAYEAGTKVSQIEPEVMVKLAENRIDKLWEKKIPYVNDDCDDIVENIENEIDLLKQLVNGLNYYTKNLSKFSE